MIVLFIALAIVASITDEAYVCMHFAILGLADIIFARRMLIG